MNQQSGDGATEEARGFWSGVWEGDLRAPLQDFIRQLFFLALTGLLELARRVLALTGIPPWLQAMIATVFDGLTVVALATLAINTLVEMLRSSYKAVRKP